ncbi:four helix bundle protein [Salinimicrobium flavum]|uniref:Four helix bundle protein n=1 Tax=Salinimicrobium flavum TaxID=1737065 RepID=A0ABW5IXG7_9FLAO
MKELLKKRSNVFAHKCVKLAIELPKNKLGVHIEGQLIRCSTSVAANYRAACLGQSKRAFISKLGIVIEEADESIFWLEFLRDEDLAKNEKFSEILQEAKELTSIFIASRITALKNLNSK